MLYQELQREVLSEIIFYCWNDRLNKLKEDDEVLVDPELPPALSNLVHELLHGGGVFAGMD